MQQAWQKARTWYNDDVMKIEWALVMSALKWVEVVVVGGGAGLPTRGNIISLVVGVLISIYCGDEKWIGNL